MAGSKNLHAGHRERVKKRFLEHGERVFDDHQLLELLLFYTIPQGDTNPLAHLLIQRFGSLDSVFNASYDELIHVPGVGKHTALFFTVQQQVMRRCLCSEGRRENIVSTIEDVGAYLKPYFLGLRRERVYLLSADQKGRVLGCDCLGEGSESFVALDNKRVVETALRHRASWVVLAHSHPSGIAIPSGDDILATLECGQILQLLSIELRDHLVFADDDYVSMRQSKMI